MTQSGTHSGDGGEPDVGSLAEEAAKLMGALSGWARDHGDLAPHVGDLASRATDALRDVDAHVATGAAECTWCPVCRTVHAVRSLNPEVRNHLASAATSLMHAVAGVLATGVPDQGRSRDVEHIDLDGDDWEDEE
ncbi:hypothetical protein [Nocardioides sp. InS609-2]|uniref:hypothetical protein n=1 Tax=Nocardioides sp. InS609-2 TaxID=2760705 RepID=UPI0020BDD419|nr:hypothetical protein [Nocardioides sp. InS609-2]